MLIKTQILNLVEPDYNEVRIFPSSIKQINIAFLDPYLAK
jgi:hypothetical protein